MQDDDFDETELDGLPPLTTERYGEMFVAVCTGVLDELDAAPMGTGATTARIARKVCERLGYDADDLGTRELFQIHERAFRHAEDEGYVLDMSSHDSKVEGLPFNLDFVKRPS
jgi:hypothetical protein